MKNISKADSRLRMTAAFVRQGSRLLDIGTDHAYLPVYLIKSGICPCAIAADVVPGPLEAAENTVRSKGLEDKIKICLSDGFDSFSEKCADDIVIAGMGGMLITDILSRCEWIRDENIRLVLQPMTHPEAVRKYLYENCFDILSEAACFSEGRVYCAINAVYTGKKTEYGIADLYIGKLAESTYDRDAAISFLKKQYGRIKKRRDALFKIGQCEGEYAVLCEITSKMERYI